MQQAYILDAVGDQPARLVVDLIPDTPEHFAAKVAADLAASTRQPGRAASDGRPPIPAPTARSPDAGRWW